MHRDKVVNLDAVEFLDENSLNLVATIDTRPLIETHTHQQMIILRRV